MLGLKKIFSCVFILLGCFMFFFNAEKASAETLIVDNDSLSSQPGESMKLRGSWNYLKAGYYGDSRITYEEDGMYIWSFDNGKNIPAGKLYAYVNNWSFTSKVHYKFQDRVVVLNQDTAPGGWNYLGTTKSAKNIKIIMKNLKSGYGAGADAMMLVY